MCLWLGGCANNKKEDQEKARLGKLRSHLSTIAAASSICSNTRLSILCLCLSECFIVIVVHHRLFTSAQNSTSFLNNNKNNTIRVYIYICDTTIAWSLQDDEQRTSSQFQLHLWDIRLSLAIHLYLISICYIGTSVVCGSFTFGLRIESNVKAAKQTTIKTCKFFLKQFFIVSPHFHSFTFSICIFVNVFVNVLNRCVSEGYFDFSVMRFFEEVRTVAPENIVFTCLKHELHICLSMRR